MQAKYFTDQFQTFMNVILEVKENLTPACILFAQSLISFLQVCMSIYSGHPELYALVYDSFNEIIS